MRALKRPLPVFWRESENSLADGKIDKLYKISSVDTCDKINNYFKKRKNINYPCYCGQQSFINFNDFLLNISLGGQLTIIPENEI